SACGNSRGEPAAHGGQSITREQRTDAVSCCAMSAICFSERGRIPERTIHLAWSEYCCAFTRGGNGLGLGHSLDHPFAQPEWCACVAFGFNKYVQHLMQQRGVQVAAICEQNAIRLQDDRFVACAGEGPSGLRSHLAKDLRARRENDFGCDGLSSGKPAPSFDPCLRNGALQLCGQRVCGADRDCADASLLPPLVAGNESRRRSGKIKRKNFACGVAFRRHLCRAGLAEAYAMPMATALEDQRVVAYGEVEGVAAHLIPSDGAADAEAKGIRGDYG